jgi:hypothetical protein
MLPQQNFNALEPEDFTVDSLGDELQGLKRVYRLQKNSPFG